MRILVTGGTGFIGRQLVRALCAHETRHELFCLVEPSQLTTTPDVCAELRHLGVRLIAGDLGLPRVSAEGAPAADVVFHLAANVDTDLPEHALRVNDLGTAHLLDWLEPSSRCRIVYTSSIAVVDRDRPPDGAITEKSPCEPPTGSRSQRSTSDLARTFGTAMGRGDAQNARRPFAAAGTPFAD